MVSHGDVKQHFSEMYFNVRYSYPLFTKFVYFKSLGLYFISLLLLDSLKKESIKSDENLAGASHSLNNTIGSNFIRSMAFTLYSALGILFMTLVEISEAKYVS